MSAAAYHIPQAATRRKSTQAHVGIGAGVSARTGSKASPGRLANALTRSGMRPRTVSPSARPTTAMPGPLRTVNGISLSTVAHREPLGVAHMEPVWQRARIPDTKMVVVLLGGVGAASTARGELLLGVLGAETLTSDLDEVRAVGQAIEGRRREQRLAEELRPLRAIAITGQQDRAALIPFVDDVVQILGAGGAQRFEPEVVEDEQVRPRVAREPGVTGAVGTTAGEVGEHLVGAHEEDLMAAATGFVREGLGEVALADTGRAEHQDALVARDELAGGEVEDLGLVEFGIETEVEALERLGGIEGGAAQAQAQLALGAPLDFVVQQHGEEVDEGGLLLDGLAIADVERLEDAGQAQGAEHRGELVGRFQ